MKKIVIVLTVFIIIVACIFTFASNFINNGTIQNEEKIKVVTTLFPEYDFVKQIGKDKVSVEILLPAGTESHTYEPTPKDIININKANAFIYTGEHMEPWVKQLINSIDSNTVVIESARNVNYIKSEEENNHEDEHEHEYDPHVWLNPLNAITMVEEITEGLCRVSPEDAEYFRKNAKEYIEELKSLDRDIENTVKEAKRDKIAFGGLFAYAYFIDRYDLKYVTAYSSCGEGAEPSVAQIKSVVDTINSENLPVVFYQELSEGKVANMIGQDTGVKTLILHTVHNVSNGDLEKDVTYISIMRENLDNLKEALN